MSFTQIRTFNRTNRRNEQPEYILQCEVADYLRLQYPTIKFTCSPAGLLLSRNLVMKALRMGYSKGTPDLWIFKKRVINGETFAGLILELKADKYGKPSAEQSEWLTYLSSNGFVTKVCRSFNESKQIIDRYLKD